MEAPGTRVTKGSSARAGQTPGAADGQIPGCLVLCCFTLGSDLTAGRQPEAPGNREDVRCGGKAFIQISCRGRQREVGWRVTVC